jgi:hypothetical protein
MPRYNYDCECGLRYEADRPYESREEPLPCECGKLATYTVAAPMIGTQPGPKGDNRIIWDDRQVEASHGSRWRETPHSDREGGAGRVMYFDPGRK